MPIADEDDGLVNTADRLSHLSVAAPAPKSAVCSNDHARKLSIVEVDIRFILWMRIDSIRIIFPLLCLRIHHLILNGPLHGFCRNVRCLLVSRDVEMDDTRVVAQGGLGILYKGEWRGCEVAIKKPVDPRAAMDSGLKEDFEREVTTEPMANILWAKNMNRIGMMYIRPFVCGFGAEYSFWNRCPF